MRAVKRSFGVSERPQRGALYQGEEPSAFNPSAGRLDKRAVLVHCRRFGRAAMRKLLRRLLFFGLLFEGLGMINLPVVLTAITVAIAITAFTHLLLVRGTNSA